MYRACQIHLLRLAKQIAGTSNIEILKEIITITIVRNIREYDEIIAKLRKYSFNNIILRPW